MCLIPLQVDADFNVMNPLLWQKSSRPVVDIEGEIKSDIVIPNTCELLAKSLEIPTSRQEDFKKWCDNQYHQNIYKNILKYCDTRIVRPKRAPIALAFGIAGFVLVGIASFGLFKNMADKTTKLESSVTSLKNSQALIEKRLTELAHKVNEAIVHINNNSRRIDYLENTLLSTILTTTGIATQFSTVKVQLIDIFKEMQQRKVSPQLFNLLNITVEEEFQYPVELMTVQTCSYDIDQSVLKFEIHGFRRHNEFILTEADPFWMKTNSGTCIYYTGPEFVLYNTREKRICHVQNRAKQKGPIIVNNNFVCKINKFESETLWKTETCKSTSSSTDLQVKSTPSGRYVYCFGHKIIMADKEFDCPNWVFSFPKGIPLIIDGETYDFFQLHYKYKVDFQPSDFDAINHFFSAGHVHT